MRTLLFEIILIIRHGTAVAESVYQSVEFHKFTVLVLPLPNLVLFCFLVGDEDT